MKEFEEYNPIAVAIYFLAVSGIAMFSINPIILLLSLLGSVSFYFARNGAKKPRSHLIFFVMFLVIAVVNPLFYHNGATVLFVLNDNPVTLESLLYGVATAMMIVSVLYWFRSFSQIMTSDRLLYLFGAASPKLSVLLSMTLRYIPLFGKQAKKVSRAQRALGLYNEDNIIDGARGGIRIFSVMVTWALENGIVTADSMSARGYGTGKRTRFALYRFERYDIALLIISLGLFALTLAGIGSGHADFEYYPYIIAPDITYNAVICYISYGVLAFLPSIIEAGEGFKWKYLKSKI